MSGTDAGAPAPPAPAPTVVTVIGGGNMGCAVLRALAGSSTVALRLATRTQATLDTYSSEHGVAGYVSPDELAGAVAGADVVVLALKPGPTLAMAATVSGLLDGSTTVVSLAAGLSLAALHGALPPSTAVVRAMPSTPMAVRSGSLSLTSRLAPDSPTMAALTALFAPAAASVVTVPESAMDAVTAVAGSGPAYVFALAEAFLDGATALGLDEATSVDLVRATLKGAVAYLDAQGPSFPAARLRQEVTSPGGTTAAALAVLSARDWHAVFVDAIAAAAARSAELGTLLNGQALSGSPSPSPSPSSPGAADHTD